MPFATPWQSLPEVEVLPNNFRRSVAGHKLGINQIRLVHPSGTPVHRHDAEEQAVMMISGEIDVTIADETIRVKAGDVCIIPMATDHCFKTIAGEAVLLEVFGPMRVQNLVGFLGKIF